MQVFEIEELFVELSNEEEAVVVGGLNAVQQQIVRQVIGAFGQGLDRVRQVVNALGWFFNLPGNGVIFGDAKYSNRDLFRYGSVPTDSPYRIGGVRIFGRWVAGI